MSIYVNKFNQAISKFVDDVGIKEKMDFSHRIDELGEILSEIMVASSINVKSFFADMELNLGKLQDGLNRIPRNSDYQKNYQYLSTFIIHLLYNIVYLSTHDNDTIRTNAQLLSTFLMGLPEIPRLPLKKINTLPIKEIQNYSRILETRIDLLAISIQELPTIDKDKLLYWIELSLHDFAILYQINHHIDFRKIILETENEQSSLIRYYQANLIYPINIISVFNQMLILGLESNIRWPTDIEFTPNSSGLIKISQYTIDYIETEALWITQHFDTQDQVAIKSAKLARYYLIFMRDIWKMIDSSFQEKSIKIALKQGMELVVQFRQFHGNVEKTLRSPFTPIYLRSLRIVLKLLVLEKEFSKAYSLIQPEKKILEPEENPDFFYDLILFLTNYWAETGDNHLLPEITQQIKNFTDQINYKNRLLADVIVLRLLIEFNRSFHSKDILLKKLHDLKNDGNLFHPNSIQKSEFELYLKAIDTELIDLPVLLLSRTHHLGRDPNTWHLPKFTEIPFCTFNLYCDKIVME